ncbi:Hpt domain-containing protein [Cyanobium gracile]|uniref:Hpt domain-containing protein n=1 Tax=Cyanobium gracile TaxID=59930 RepID=UPI0005BE5CCF|nr:Hpt domain-containing protein [Cyanobium gracile]
MTLSSDDSIDTRSWDDLRELGGPDADAMIAELIDIYAEDAAQLVSSLLKARQAGDRPSLVAAAHALRSPSASLGALRLAERCRLLELAAGAAAAELPAGLIDDLLRELERVLAALTSLRPQP